ncbi:MAG: NAD(P)/FAD-dependent oxidoreductase [Bacteroidota bacterium]
MHVVILGGGLSGLTTAYLLQSHPVKISILEGRDRLGGRIWTKLLAGNTRAEAGATWFTKSHTHLAALLAELNIGDFAQHVSGTSLLASAFDGTAEQFQVPESEPASFRIKGGSSTLIQALAGAIDGIDIQLSTPVASITFGEKGCALYTSAGAMVEADLVVSTLPPRMLAHTVALSPGPPKQWFDVATNTQTWMGNAAKFYVAYKHPFWRDKGFSGMAFGHGGIIPEMYDHASDDETSFALKGFLGPQVYALSPNARRDAVLQQLSMYFGAEAKEVLEYGDILWGNDPFARVATGPELMPHQNNGHPLLRQPLYERRLIVSGAETASMYAGYMDGAVRAARHAASQVLAHL